ncbi:IS1182 family transposase [Streptomyces sp. bgisy159]|uniref:IS1182 family transposase n=1 Tax=Streptomyces sp. bgisy159 TaxID=3413795 RepID=UPI003F4A6744
MTAQVARASNPNGTTAMWVRDRLDGLWRDEDFAAWYSRNGRPGLSPAQLATVSVLQFLLNLSDRQAAEAVRCRIDVKYALALELDDPGFHHSVLSDFRDRLAENGRADALFDLALARLKDAGLVKARGRQRTDSTCLLASVRELTRLELVLEAVRAALEETARTNPQLLDGLVDEDWALRYGRQVRLVSQPSRPATRLKQAGADAFRLLDHARGAGTTPGPAVEALRQITMQNFLVDAHGRPCPRAEKDGLPPARLRIESPYGLQARWVRRGHRRWTGYLAHVTETCDDRGVNVITDVATTVPTADSTALPGIRTRLERRHLLPAQHLVDGGYTSVALMDTAARTHRIEVIGPVAPDNSWQSKAGTGFTREDFAVDFDRRQVTCPGGKTSGNWTEPPSQAPYTLVAFDARHCSPCPHRSGCTRSTDPRKGRTVHFLPRRLHDLQAQNRADQQDPQWRRLYASRSGVEGTANVLANAHQMRRCRYRGTAKAHIQHVLTAISVNIARLSTQEPDDSTYRPRPPTAFQQYLDAQELPRPRWWRQGQ